MQKHAHVADFITQIVERKKHETRNAHGDRADRRAVGGRGRDMDRGRVMPKFRQSDLIRDPTKMVVKCSFASFFAMLE